MAPRLKKSSLIHNLPSSNKKSSYPIEELAHFPKDPGVYLMKDAKGRVLYIGKAKNLQARVKQYFGSSQEERPYIPFLIQKVISIETIVVFSEKEALLLENTLIKKHKPKYNILLKDDKSYISLRIKESQWPSVEMVRYKGKPPSKGTYFGPYLNAFEARTLLDVIQHSFPLRQCSDKELVNRTRPCILYQMKRCIAPCCHKCTEEEYSLHVKRVHQFLKGQDKELLESLYKEMQSFSNHLEFEKAQETYLRIQRIESAREKQQVNKIGRIDLDALGLYREGSEVTLCQLLFREEKLTALETYHFSNAMQEDNDLIASFLLQHYAFEANPPAEILISTSLTEKSSLEEILSAEKKHKVLLHVPKRGEKLQLLEMALKNAKANFHKEKDSQAILQKTLLDLQEKLSLSKYPHRIDCFDNSHLSGTLAVSCMITYIEGQKAPSLYRKYTLKKANAFDDFSSMYEVLHRRYAKAKIEDTLPDLVILDGGKGHLNIAKKVFEELNIIGVNLIALAKEEGRHDKGLSQEQIFLLNRKDALLLPPNSSLLFFLQQVRDEAHRYTLAFQKAKRSKQTIRSALREIPGIGPTKTKRLLMHFKSVKAIFEADIEAFKMVKGISEKDIASITLWKKTQEEPFQN